jgi:hypothetical protein
VGLLAAGFALMGKAYRQFRFGQEFEFRRGKEGGGLINSAINTFAKLVGWT